MRIKLETKANYVLVGSFAVIIFILACILFAILTNAFKRPFTEPLDVYIQGSAAGLSQGSSVYFNGVSVGVVKKLFLDPKNPNIAIASCNIHKNIPITKSTNALIAGKGVTGVSFIELLGGDIHEPLLLEEAKKNKVVASLIAKPASFNSVLTSVQKISFIAEEAINDIHKLVKDLHHPLIDTMSNIKTVTDSLEENKKLFEEAHLATKNFNEASLKIKKILQNIDTLTSPNSKNNLVDKILKTANSIQTTAMTLNKHITPIVQNIEIASGRSLKNFESLFTSLDRSIKRMERAISDLEKDPSRIIWGGKNNSLPIYNENK